MPDNEWWVTGAEAVYIRDGGYKGIEVTKVIVAKVTNTNVIAGGQSGKNTLRVQFPLSSLCMSPPPAHFTRLNRSDPSFFVDESLFSVDDPRADIWVAKARIARSASTARKALRGAADSLTIETAHTAIAALTKYLRASGAPLQPGPTMPGSTGKK